MACTTQGRHTKNIRATVYGGKIQRFGKNNLKFTKSYKRFIVTCVDEIKGERIKIVTVVVEDG